MKDQKQNVNLFWSRVIKKRENGEEEEENIQIVDRNKIIPQILETVQGQG